MSNFIWTLCTGLFMALVIYVTVHYHYWRLLQDLREDCEKCEYRKSIAELQEQARRDEDRED